MARIAWTPPKGYPWDQRANSKSALCFSDYAMNLKDVPQVTMTPLIKWAQQTKAGLNGDYLAAPKALVMVTARGWPESHSFSLSNTLWFNSYLSGGQAAHCRVSQVSKLSTLPGITGGSALAGGKAGSTVFGIGLEICFASIPENTVAISPSEIASFHPTQAAWTESCSICQGTNVTTIPAVFGVHSKIGTNPSTRSHRVLTGYLTGCHKRHDKEKQRKTCCDQ